MKKDFNKNASSRIIAYLHKELSESRLEVESTTRIAKEMERYIKEAKQRLTTIGRAIGMSNSWNDLLVILNKEREETEKQLAYYKKEFKDSSKDARDSKEMVRHLQHAITTLKKEFGL